MSEPDSLLETALELLVYAPVGIAISAAEELPQLIAKGRQRLGGQVETARMIGRFAVTTGQRQAGRVVSGAAARLVHPGSPDGTRAASTVREKPAPARASSDRQGATTRMSARTGGDVRAPDSSTLAIPGYDSLSASQVVQRLGGLTQEELEQVRTYESSTRGRKTILHRVTQLQTASSS